MLASALHYTTPPLTHSTDPDLLSEYTLLPRLARYFHLKLLTRRLPDESPTWRMELAVAASASSDDKITAELLFVHWLTSSHLMSG